MTKSSVEKCALLDQLLDHYEQGYTLEGKFYTDDSVYRHEIDRIWRDGWLFVGHSCEIVEPGDYLTFQLDTDPILVIRDDASNLHAMHNICRHRGMPLCDSAAGHLKQIVCPYHQWTYARDGNLVRCRGMQEDLNKADYRLHQLPLKEIGGLIFISLSSQPPNFEGIEKLYTANLHSQGLQQAKVAKIVDYEVQANWKLIWENNRECYHCNVNHPQYIKANYDHYNQDDTPQRVKKIIAEASARSEAKWAASGLTITHQQSGMTCFPDPENDIWYSLNRTPLAEGFVSETLDGKQVAPLMGEYRDADVGTLRMRAMPNFWNHSSCDHSVSTRLLPAGIHRTLIRVTWLVDRDATEGKDYKLEEIMPYWQFTSEQDWEICENAQRGMLSSGFTPGPLSSYKEYNVQRFFTWYLKQLRTCYK